MGLGRKLLGAARPGWFLLVAAATIAVYSGNAEPLVSSSQVPQGPLYMFAAPAAALLVGWLLIGLLGGSLEKGAWRKAGRAAGLEPEGGSGIGGRSKLTGTVQGRRVQARTVRQTTVRGGEDANTTRTFTVVEADLDRPLQQALVVVPSGGGQISVGDTTVRLARLLEEAGGEQLTVVEGNRLTFASPQAEFVEAVRSSPGASALAGLDEVNVVYAGDANALVSRMLAGLGDGGSGAGGWLQGAMVDRAQDAIADRVPDDPTSTSLEALGVVEDGDRLRHQVEAIAAFADVLEEAAQPQAPTSSGPDP